MRGLAVGVYLPVHDMMTIGQAGERASGLCGYVIIPFELPSFCPKQPTNQPTPALALSPCQPPEP